MRRAVVLRVGVGVAVAMAALLAVVLIDLVDRGSTGDSLPAGPQVQVQPAPQGGAGPTSEVGPTSEPAAAVTDLPSATPTAAPGVRVPDLILTARAMLARAETVRPPFAYQSAVQARDARDFALAGELFASVARGEHELAPFAALRAAQMLGLDGQVEASAQAFASLIAPGGAAESLPDSVRVVAYSEAATALEEAGHTSEALAALERIPDVTGSTFQLAESYADRAGILQEAGDPAWVDLAILAMETQPGAEGAREALDLLDEAGVGYPQLVAALVAYRGYRNDDAHARYTDLLDSGTLTAAEAGQAWFYLGALEERYFEREAALEAYSRSLLVAPDGAWADDARYWRGRVMEELGWVNDAAVEYDRLAEAYPESTFVADARLRAAVALGLAGDGVSATSRLASIASSSAPEEAAEAARWHDVLVDKFGAPPAADLAAGALDPTSHFAAFERAGDAAAGALPEWSIVEEPAVVEVDSAEIEAWLAGRVGPRTVEAASVVGTPEVEIAWLLASVGEGGIARSLLASEVNSRRDEPYAVLDLALAARERALHDVALSAASLLLRDLSPQEYLAAPRSLLALAYPLAYLGEATQAAEEFGVPVLLLMALVRQESAFNPEAGSSAGAFGLTQVIYPTGEAIAQDLDMGSWTFADLARPSVAMRFGAYYLSVQLDSFDGHYLAALSAYNGGPGNASRWLDVQPFGGPDGYVYAVDFTETRAYLERVTSNYAMYRYIYTGAGVPSLPHGG